MKYKMRGTIESLKDRRIRLNRAYTRLMERYKKLSTEEELATDKEPIRRKLAIIKARLTVVRVSIHNC